MGAYTSQYIPYYFRIMQISTGSLRFCRIKKLRYMWTHAIAIVRYSLYTTLSFLFKLKNAVIFNILKNGKYLDIVYGSIHSFASIKVFWFWFYNKISTSEKGIKETRDRQADRQRDWQTDRRTDLHTVGQTKRHAAGVREKKRMRPGEKNKEREGKDENQRIP